MKLIELKYYQFTTRMTQMAPDCKDGFVLRQGGHIIYIGTGSPLIDRLEGILAGEEGELLASADCFAVTFSGHPEDAAKELLEEFERSHGRLPVGNR